MRPPPLVFCAAIAAAVTLTTLSSLAFVAPAPPQSPSPTSSASALQLKRKLQQQRLIQLHQEEWCAAIGKVLRLFHAKVRPMPRGIGKCDHMFPTEFGYSALKQNPSGSYFHHVLASSSLRAKHTTQMIQANDSLAFICREETRRPVVLLPLAANRSASSDASIECSVYSSDQKDKIKNVKNDDEDQLIFQKSSEPAHHFVISSTSSLLQEKIVWAPPAAAASKTASQRKLYPGAATRHHSFLSLGAKSWTFSNSNKSSVASHDSARLQMYFATSASSHRIDVGNYLPASEASLASAASAYSGDFNEFREQKCAGLSDFFLLLGYPVSHIFDSQNNDCTFAITIRRPTSSRRPLEDFLTAPDAPWRSQDFESDQLYMSDFTRVSARSSINYLLGTRMRGTGSRAALAIVASIRVSYSIAIEQEASLFRITCQSLSGEDKRETIEIKLGVEFNESEVGAKCGYCAVTRCPEETQDHNCLIFEFAEYDYLPSGRPTILSRQFRLELRRHADAAGPSTSLVSKNFNSTISQLGRAAQLTNTATKRNVRINLAFAPSRSVTKAGRKSAPATIYHGAHFVASVTFPLFPHGYP